MINSATRAGALGPTSAIRAAAAAGIAILIAVTPLTADAGTTGRPHIRSLPVPAESPAVPQSAAVSAPTAHAVELVVNSDGSATLSAELQNPTRVDRFLLGVVVESDQRQLAVASTIMKLALPLGAAGRVGDASDAGGFVIPDGITVGHSATVHFRFDDGTSFIALTTAVRRTGAHAQVFPTNGSQLGPAR
jgi:hypothetical protein